ncbi:lactate racemase domain-containing protein [Cytobacillus firmus]|uniref:lactate racemase domain-containing protein n=1 Tax=Cytobacillus firmus TaxID=1399 RepID=UPI001C94DCF1|nr:lactate racemase domain-containing protein [Cytobacillus firmus]MBY6051059.1 nickel-dependent lactate racemase [Cytobacillus firmus]
MIELIEIHQKFTDSKLQRIEEAVSAEIEKHLLTSDLPKNAQMAITAGSRGISNIVIILRTIVKTLKAKGLVPFLVPAMGSHGGATAEGQIEVLHHLGITEESVGAPIKSSMDVEHIGDTVEGTPVYMDRHAYSADGIIVVNRVKAHTAFRGRVESGLSKMIAIGLGKIKGAAFIHRDGAMKMASNIESVSRVALEKSPILFGLAIVENGFDETALIEGIEKKEWHKKEAGLLKKSKLMMPSLPVESADLLIIEEMGKCFSGTGMDPNIIGRWRISGVEEPESPRINRIVVLDLAEKSFGNAQGIGLADFTTDRLFNKIDRKSTYTNALTSTYLQRAMLPLIYQSEKDAIETALQSLGPGIEKSALKIIQIPNTLHLGKVLVSNPVINELEQSGNACEKGIISALEFNENGDLIRKITE